MNQIKNTPLVSIVILNWNSEKFIHQCIQSVLKQSYHNYEVVFVDNFSSDMSLTESKERYPHFTFIENRRNLGFAAGMNVGINACNGKYVVLLNTDVYLDSNYLAETVSLLEGNPEVSCTASYEYKWDFPNLTDRKVGEGTWGIALHLRVVGCPPPKDSYTFGVSGSYPVFRKETIDEIINLRGYFFDEKFGTGWEDTELRFLFAYLNKKTMICKSTKAWHIGSAADDGNIGMFDKSLSYQQRIFRNRMYIIGKYIKRNYWLWFIYICVVNMIIDIYVRCAHKESVPYLKSAKLEYNNNKQIINQENKVIRSNMKIKKRELFHFVVSL